MFYKLGASKSAIKFNFIFCRRTCGRFNVKIYKKGKQKERKKERKDKMKSKIDFVS